MLLDCPNIWSPTPTHIGEGAGFIGTSRQRKERKEREECQTTINALECLEFLGGKERNERKGKERTGHY